MPSAVQWAGPLVLLGSSLMLAALVPMISVVAPALVPGDLFVVVSVLLVGTVWLAVRHREPNNRETLHP